MNPLDSLLGNLGGGLGGALGGALGGSPGASAAPAGSPLLQLALSLLAGDGKGGGLDSLIGAFQRNGLGDVVQSWIGTGENLPISAEQLQQALGGDRLQDLARGAGLSGADASSGLAELLPQLIDRLTPQGQVPTGGTGDLGSLIEALAGRRG